MPVTVCRSPCDVAASRRLTPLLMASRRHGMAVVLPPFMYGLATTTRACSRSMAVEHAADVVDRVAEVGVEHDHVVALRLAEGVLQGLARGGSSRVWCSTRTPVWVPANASAMAPVSSVEPSSTTSTSNR